MEIITGRSVLTYMDKGIAAEWANRLEDDTRHQGYGFLRNRFGQQCCLDVLCEIAAERGVLDEPVFDEELDSYEYVWHDDNGQHNTCEMLPGIVARWAGINVIPADTVADPSVDFNGEARKLSWLNDIGLQTFPDIASIIREAVGIESESSPSV